jgi:hypothetical protein
VLEFGLLLGEASVSPSRKSTFGKRDANEHDQRTNCEIPADRLPKHYEAEHYEAEHYGHDRQ